MDLEGITLRETGETEEGKVIYIYMSHIFFTPSSVDGYLG